jgi:hypothetical protein
VVHAVYRQDAPTTTDTYLVSTFHSSDESFALWTTTDGLTYTERKIEYRPAKASHSQAARNANLIYYDGRYYLSHSEGTQGDGGLSCPTFNVATSIDGYLFYPLARISSGFQRAWPAHFFKDTLGDGSIYILLAGSTTSGTADDFTINAMKQTTAGNFSVWNAAVAFAGGTINASGDSFDAQITITGGSYFLMYHGSNQGDRPTLWKSSSPFSGYSAWRTGDWMADGVSYSIGNNDQPVLYNFGGTVRFGRDDNTGSGLRIATQTSGDVFSRGATRWGAPAAIGGATILKTIDVIAKP